MTAPRFRSRRLRRIHTRTPGGNLVIHYKRRNKGKPQCRECKAFLKGVARGTIHTVKKLSKTQRRPERPYGGVLCSKCMRKLMVAKARALVVKNG